MAPASLKSIPDQEPGVSGFEMGPIVRDSLASQAYRRIRNALMQSHYPPGHKLVLRTVATELNISMTPLREAFARLVSENALTVDARGMVCVPIISPQQHKEIRDLRIELEGRAAHAAVPRITDAAVTELKDINELYFNATAAGDRATAFKANEEFHFRLYAFAEMPILFSIIEGLWMRSGPILAVANPKSSQPVRRHGRIIMGLELRDPELVRHGIAEDIANGWSSRQNYQDN